MALGCGRRQKTTNPTVRPDMPRISHAQIEREEKMGHDIVPILKPCPFCGDRPQIVHTGTFIVQCADCGASGPPAPNMERAAVRWNRRKGEDF
jgi:Lar family restriction alleviation protein